MKPASIQRGLLASLAATMATSPTAEALRRKDRFSAMLSAVVAIVAVIVTLVPIVLLDNPWPVVLRDHLEAHGVAESGARNLVSAIYLGYRAFDTLGETIVLLVAVSGTIGMIAGAGGTLARGYAAVALADSEPAIDGELPAVPPAPVPRAVRNSRQRTDLIDVVTGKLGPVVLIFGLYVMMFGHLSPGGGFQGGVVVASGIVFLALGSKAGSRSFITEPDTLARIEAAGFLCLIVAGLAGSFSGAGFFGNPLSETGASPVAFIILLNAVIGLKVGAGISFMCVAMLGEAAT
jgi:multicomponent Na+:H+ antiporter subunit B